MIKVKTSNEYNFFHLSHENRNGKSSLILKIAAMSLGFSTLVVQIILLREFLSVFNGNELVIGIILANWMILTGAGAYAGRFTKRLKNKDHLTIVGLILIGLLPLITTFLLSYLKNLVYPVGSMVSIIQIFFNSFILLMPFCILSGFLFTHLSRLVSEYSTKNLIAKVYAYESFGSIIGGVVFNLVLIYYLRTFESLIVVMISNFCVAVLLAHKTWTKSGIILLTILSIILVFICFKLNLDFKTKEYLFPDQNIEYYEDTPYGSLTITGQGNQKNFYENNMLIFSTNEVTANEETVHYAMIQHPDPKRVLLISGGISGTIDEILKYDVEKIDYVELNPWILKIGEKYGSALNNEKVNTINADGRIFIRETKNMYDVVLINLPLPTTARINRYYTVEFFSELKMKLSPDAVVSLSSIATTDYLSREAIEINSILLNTLKKSFRNVLIIPGYKIFFAASDNELNIDIARQIESSGIDNSFVNKYYIDDELLKERSDKILNQLDKTSQVNRDFNPISYYSQLVYWLSYFKFNFWVIPVIIVFSLVFLFRNSNAISFGMFAGGFAATSMEIILLLSFQIIYGYVYQMLGIIITIFFTGLAVGAFYYKIFVKHANINKFISVQAAIGIYSIMLALLLFILKSNDAGVYLLHAIFFVLTFLMAVMIGIEFALATNIRHGGFSEVASEMYGFDLIGSAVGAIFVTVYLIPLLGMIWVGVIVGLINLFAAIITLLNKKKYVKSF